MVPAVKIASEIFFASAMKEYSTYITCRFRKKHSASESTQIRSRISSPGLRDINFLQHKIQAESRKHVGKKSEVHGLKCSHNDWELESASNVSQLICNFSWTALQFICSICETRVNMVRENALLYFSYFQQTAFWPIYNQFTIDTIHWHSDVGYIQYLRLESFAFFEAY